MNIVRSKEAEKANIVPTKTYKANSYKESVWEISFAPGVWWGYYFLAIGHSEQDAIDEVIDYCEKHMPGLLLDDEYIAELRADSIKQGFDDDEFLNEAGTYGGNHGKYLCTPEGIRIRRIIY